MSKANVPKQFSATSNGRFRDVGIRNPWEKEDLNRTNPPQRFYLEGTQDPRANPNLHWLVDDEPITIVSSPLAVSCGFCFPPKSSANHKRGRKDAGLTAFPILCA